MKEKCEEELFQLPSRFPRDRSATGMGMDGTDPATVFPTLKAPPDGPQTLVAVGTRPRHISIFATKSLPLRARGRRITFEQSKCRVRSAEKYPVRPSAVPQRPHNRLSSVQRARLIELLGDVAPRWTSHAPAASSKEDVVVSSERRRALSTSGVY